MIYSCFNPRLGLYDYFEDSISLPINADLPIPKLPKDTQMGVASIEAGRPLPGGAQRTGQGWHAKGIIVQCGASGTSRASMSGLADSVSGGVYSFLDGIGQNWMWFAGGIGAAILIRKALLK